MTRTTVSLLLMISALAAATPAVAAPAEIVTREVRYNDLDLSDAAGVKALHHRISRAANEVCLDSSGPSPAPGPDASCVGDARRDALRQLQISIGRSDGR